MEDGIIAVVEVHRATGMVSGAEITFTVGQVNVLDLFYGVPVLYGNRDSGAV